MKARAVQCAVPGRLETAPRRTVLQMICGPISRREAEFFLAPPCNRPAAVKTGNATLPAANRSKNVRPLHQAYTRRSLISSTKNPQRTLMRRGPGNAMPYMTTDFNLLF